MTCEISKAPGGAVAIVCSPGRRKPCACGRRADRLCDWKVAGKRSGTCDAPVCSRCSVSPAPEKDLCPDHAAAFQERSAKRAGSAR